MSHAGQPSRQRDGKLRELFGFASGDDHDEDMLTTDMKTSGVSPYFSWLHAATSSRSSGEQQRRTDVTFGPARPRGPPVSSLARRPFQHVAERAGRQATLDQHRIPVHRHENDPRRRIPRRIADAAAIPSRPGIVMSLTITSARGARQR